MPMPQLLLATTDHDGRVIAAQADDQRVRWQDLDTVVMAVEQFNQDCARAGIRRPPLPLPEVEIADDTDGES
jgi:hypothetical protein